MLSLLLRSKPVVETYRETLRRFRDGPKWRVLRHANRTIATIQALDSWDNKNFRERAFVPQTPATLPRQDSTSPTAIKKWFSSNSHVTHTKYDDQIYGTMGLEESFWLRYSDLIVPLEITYAAVNMSGGTDFARIQGPLHLLLADLTASNSGVGIAKQSVYLAQHDLRDLPQELQDDLPTPKLVTTAGKGDLYSSSLWLGKSPTYTPLHQDPNPNLLMQLAGTKSIRLFHPEIGNAIFEYVQRLIELQSGALLPRSSRAGSASFRGEEMMKGAERMILHDIIWTEMSKDIQNEAILEHVQCATLSSGQALFIPKGWWHSVKGVGDGVTASANWWFR